MKDSLPGDIQERVAARVRTGVYQSEGDVLRYALDALDQLEEEKITRWRERNALSQQQSEQGLSKPLDEQAVLNRLRERLARDGVMA